MQNLLTSARICKGLGEGCFCECTGLATSPDLLLHFGAPAVFGQLACFCLAFHADFLLLVSAPGTCCQPPLGILRMVVVTGFCQKSFILGMLVLYLMSAGKGFGFIAANSPLQNCRILSVLSLDSCC